MCILLKGLPSEAQVLVLFLLLGGQFKFASWEGDAWVDSRHLGFPFLLQKRTDSSFQQVLVTEDQNYQAIVGADCVHVCLILCVIIVITHQKGHNRTK